MRRRLFILSVLLLTVCGQMWAGRSGIAGASSSFNGISYTLYSNYSYYYYWSGQSKSLGNVAVITSCSNSTMVIPESLGGCNQIVIGESALTQNVTSLTISKSVKLLEYCAVYYADQIQTLTIEDSENPLYCGGTKYSYSYGAFSFIEKLKSVYIGRNLEYEHTDTDHDYAPFRYCESVNFDMTIGPLATKIADYCFENCNIKSLTMMRSLPQAVQKNPITFGTGAFNNTSNVPCYVSWTTLNNFQNYSDYKNMFNYQLGAEPCRYEALEKLKLERQTTSYQDILSELEAGCAGYETAINNTSDVNQMQLLMTRAFAVMELLKQKRDYPSNAAASVVSEYKTKIDNANTVEKIEEARNAGKQALMDAKELQDVKATAITELNTAKTTYPSDAADGIVTTYTDKIYTATTKNAVNAAKNEGIQALLNAKDLQDAKAVAINALNTEAGDSPSEAVAALRDTWIANVNNATTVNDVNTCKNNGIAAVQLQKAKDSAIAELTEAKVANPSGAADDIFNEYKASINAATSIDEVTAVKEEGIQKLQEYFVALEDEKASANAELDAAKSQYPSEYADDIVNNCKTEIEAATTIEDVKNAKDEGIKNLQLEYNNLQDLKNKAIAELDHAKKDYPSGNASSIVAEGKNAIENAKSQSEVIKKKEYYIAQLMTAFTAELTNAKNDAINALNQAKDEYPSDAAEGIVSTYTGKIHAATSTDAITAAKEEGVQALKDANELQNARETAIAELTSAVEDYPSDAADGIASTYTGKINAATSTDAITAAKEEGIRALIDAYNAQKEAERLAALDAVTVTQTAEDDYSYMLEDGVRFEFDGDNVNMTVDGKDEAGFTLSETVAIKICPARTFKLKANQDPDNTSDYYSTFYTSEGAYKVPSEAKAYAGTVESGEETDVLKLTDVGKIIHQSEAVILKASQSDITLMPSCNKDSTSTKNALEGTDEGKNLTTNQYALSLGQNGVGFYLWEGKKIGANKAYLIWDGSEAGAKAFTFKFDDGEVDAIHSINVNDSSTGSETNDNLYNLNGLRVGKDYKGIVIKNGKKVYQK